MIIVTGATGKLGGKIVEHLARRVSAAEIGVSVRDPEKASDLRALGVRIRPGDFNDAASLRNAFEGAAQVLIVSSNAAAYGEDPLAQHRNAIAAAVEVGARRVVYTSHMGASHSSAFPPMLDHAATEAMLKQSGLAWTALRNGFYAQSGIDLMGDPRDAGVIDVPEDGKVAWTAHADLAEAAAVILANEGQFDGPTPPLTAAQALDFADFAAIASQAWGQPIRREAISDEDFRARLESYGVPGYVINLAIGLYIASRNGEFAAVDPTLEGLLGRAPLSIRDLFS